MAVNIFLNGEARAVSPSLSLSQLLVDLHLTHQRIAVEINQEIVPRSQYEHTVLKTDDKVEIVTAIGGG